MRCNLPQFKLPCCGDRDVTPPNDSTNPAPRRASGPTNESTVSNPPEIYTGAGRRPSRSLQMATLASRSEVVANASTHGEMAGEVSISTAKGKERAPLQENSHVNDSASITAPAKAALSLPALFHASNLKFLTKREGALPTLYFNDGNSVGRIRQQHEIGGSAIEMTSDKPVDYFFSDKKQLSAFHKELSKMKAGLSPAPDPSMYGASTTPTEGSFHYDVTYNKDGQLTSRHASGGTVSLDTGSYDDNAISHLYANIPNKTFFNMS